MISLFQMCLLLNIVCFQWTISVKLSSNWNPF
jgi:hypothetical protein